MNLGRACPILLLEDDPDDVSFIRRALALSNIANEVVVVTTAQEAKNYLLSRSDHAPGLAVIDLYLPNGESGLDFLRWLRSRPEAFAAMPAMVFTQSGSHTHKAEAENLGSLRFVTKPVNEASLSEAVQSLGFVVMTTTDGGRLRRVIEPRDQGRHHPTNGRSFRDSQ